MLIDENSTEDILQGEIYGGNFYRGYITEEIFIDEVSTEEIFTGKYIYRKILKRIL